MPMQWIPPEVALEYKGVTIYHIYKNDDMEQGKRTFWFGKSVEATDRGDDDNTIDVRTLPTFVAAAYAASEQWKGMSDDERAMFALKAAIDQGLLKNEEEAEE